MFAYILYLNTGNKGSGCTKDLLREGVFLKKKINSYFISYFILKQGQAY